MLKAAELDVEAVKAQTRSSSEGVLRNFREALCAGSAGTAAGADAGAQQGTAGDNVVDAEYTEVNDD